MLESLQHPGIARQSFRQDIQSHLTAKLQIPGLSKTLVRYRRRILSPTGPGAVENRARRLIVDRLKILFGAFKTMPPMLWRTRITRLLSLHELS